MNKRESDEGDALLLESEVDLSDEEKAIAVRKVRLSIV